ncbi:hypothetical protein [Carnobacterium maltaromaticum]
MKLTLKQLNDIEYLFIFEYFDQPLFFVAKSNRHAYLFFYFDEGKYLYSPLEIADIDLLMTNESNRSILNRLISYGTLDVLHVSDTVEYYSISDYEEKFGLNIEDLLPKEKFNRKFDYQNNLSIVELAKQYQDIIQDLLPAKNISLRLVDENDSSVLPVDDILKTIDLMKKYIKATKKQLGNKEVFSNAELKLNAFSPGSFIVEFVIDEGSSLFDDQELTFETLINTVEALNDDGDYVDDNLSEDVLDAIQEYYNYMKVNKLTTEFIVKEKKITNITKKSVIFEDNIMKMKDKIKSKNIPREEEERLKVDGELLSASLVRNSFTIKTVQGKYSGKFDANLLKSFKENERTFNEFPCSVIADLIMTRYYDSSNNEVNKTYTMIEFTQ